MHLSKDRYTDILKITEQIRNNGKHKIPDYQPFHMSSTLFWGEISDIHCLLRTPRVHCLEQLIDSPPKKTDVLLSKVLQYNKYVVCTKDTIEQV